MDLDARPQPRDVGTSQPPPDVDEWLIEGVLRPKAILMVASAEGVGKSYTRKEMAIRMSSCGGRLFDFYPIPRRCKILEIDEENGEAEEFRREEQVFAALSVSRDEVKGNYRSVSFTALDLGEQTSRDYLRQQLVACQPDVLMLDTGTSMVDDEWGSEFKPVMRFLRALTVQHSCAVVVFVHLVKPSRHGRGGRNPGSSLSDVMGQWTRTVDAVALIADLGEGRANWSMRKKVPRSELVIEQDSGLWRVVRVGAVAKPTNGDRVLRAIHAGGTNTKEISASLGISSRSVSTAIGKLRIQGLLVVVFPYRLTKKGLEAVQ